MVVGASAPWRLLYFPISYAQARRNNAKATRTITRKIPGQIQIQTQIQGQIQIQIQTQIPGQMLPGGSYTSQ